VINLAESEAIPPKALDHNTIYCGNNEDVLRRYVSNDSVDLLYADPPFFSNQQYEALWKDGYELRAFEDRWKGGIQSYVAWMEPKLRECQRVLKPDGAMYLHCDWHAVHYLKIEMDKVFGESNFRNEISVKRIRKNVNEYKTVKRLNVAFDSILFYAKTDLHRITPPLREKHRPARWHAFDANGLRTGMDYDLFGRKPPAGGHWRWTKERSQQAIEEKRLRANPLTGSPEYLIPESTHELMTSFWDDIPAYSFKMGYPTEKSVELLKRIIGMSSKSSDLVLDPFCGCGTALVAAQTLGRSWVGIDISPTACRLMKDRLRKEFKIDTKVIGMPRTAEELKALQPFEFQNWVFEKLHGRANPKLLGDPGIDGFVELDVPVRVKQVDAVDQADVASFETHLKRAGKRRGVMVSFSFGEGAHKEVSRLRLDLGLDIRLVTVDAILGTS